MGGDGSPKEKLDKAGQYAHANKLEALRPHFLGKGKQDVFDNDIRKDLMWCLVRKAWLLLLMTQFVRKPLSELNQDEKESNGALAAILNVLKCTHQMFFEPVLGIDLSP
ncbi:hypothetical protein HPP92_025850 [Vanilla planifolia]|uniref:Uncharacterized protein n=1 Tax=Vanilla planifolia TaxID=51239 RepID=A0A835U8B0_VANPL|nr:hypothetical protein HPP92_025850 [Vanilla planifolia]